MNYNNEIIGYRDIATLSDWDYHCSDDKSKIIPRGIVPPNNSVVHVALDEICEFFNLIKETTNKYIIISTMSDYGLEYQERQPVWRDIVKWTEMQTTPALGYNGISMPPRCELSKCKITDKYSVKMHSWTGSTFNEVPSNVVWWFSTNNNLGKCSLPITSIPFGMDTKCKEIISNLTPEQLNQPRKLLYINFSANTMERFKLKYFYAQNKFDGVNLVAEPKKSKEEYIQDLLTHEFILCPTGNGLDSYRIMETLLCGCIPIVPNISLFWDFISLPIQIFDMFNCMSHIKDVNRKILIEQSSYKLTHLSYWKDQIEQKRKELLS